MLIGQVMRSLSGLISLALLLSACSREEALPVPAETEGIPLVVYASIPRERVKPILDAFTAETGKKIQIRPAGREPAVEPFDVAGTLPSADLFLLDSLAGLWRVAERDGFRPTFSPSIDAEISPELRDPESRWTSLGVNARLIVYNSESLAEDSLDNVVDYAVLGTEPWRGKLCLSSVKIPGNLTLVAFLIQKYDLREAEITVRRWQANLAANVFKSDAALVDAIAAGQCTIGIAGSNALAAHLAANAESPVLLHIFADPAEVVIDVSGGGVGRHAHNPEGAAELLVWLTTNAPNALYAAQGREFPANYASSVLPAIESWRESVSAPTALSDLAYLHDEAVLLAERAKYP